MSPRDTVCPTDLRESVDPARFRVSWSAHCLSGLMEAWRPLWIGVGGLESAVLRERLRAVAIREPIYVCGLARAGSTILLEMLARHPAVATHRYRDFPFLFWIYGWNRFLDRIPKKDLQPVERAHQDGLHVTIESPEAMEEVLWMGFFKDLHNPACDNVLDGATQHARFEAFYRDHIGKVLLLRGGTRYACKENYHVTRLEYLRKLFPDARFVVPIRHPVSHVASLIRQHRLFSAAAQGHPRVAAHMRRSGHFEFGPDRRPISPGVDAVRDVRALWDAGDEARGTARYWSIVYRHLHDRLTTAPELKEASMIVRFEDLCDGPSAVLAALFDYARLPVATDFVSVASASVRRPSHAASVFTADELAAIHEETRETAALFGYDEASYDGEA